MYAYQCTLTHVIRNISSWQTHHKVTLASLVNQYDVMAATNYSKPFPMFESVFLLDCAYICGSCPLCSKCVHVRRRAKGWVSLIKQTTAHLLLIDDAKQEYVWIEWFAMSLCVYEWMNLLYNSGSRPLIGDKLADCAELWCHEFCSTNYTCEGRGGVMFCRYTIYMY